MLGMSVSVLSHCANGNYGGYKNNSRVVLQVKLHEYGILGKILCRNVLFIHKLALPQIIKDELLRDMRTIRTILEKSETEVVK
jgi:hypothetical protein